MASNATGGQQLLLSAMIEISLPRSIRFWLLLIFEIPSVICSSILLYYLLLDRTLRNALNNHVIIALVIAGLLCQLFDIPIYMTFLHLGYVWPTSPGTCYLWWLSRIGMFNLVGILLAWGSIERHILVFHHHWLSSARKRFFMHYLPLLVLVFYGVLFYIMVLFFPLCRNTFYYTVRWCLYPCFFRLPALATYDTLINGILPTLIVAIFNLCLLIRVVIQKHHLHQQTNWRKYRRMILQLVSCSGLFLAVMIPMNSLVLTHVFGKPYYETSQFELYMYFLVNLLILWLPFIYLGSLPEIWTKVKRHIQTYRVVATVTPIV